MVSVNSGAEDCDFRIVDDCTKGSELVFDVNVEDCTETTDSLEESRTSEDGTAVGDI